MEYIIVEQGRLFKADVDEPVTIEQLKNAIIQHLHKVRNTAITDRQYDLLADYAEGKGIGIGEAIEEIFHDIDILKEKAKKL